MALALAVAPLQAQWASRGEVGFIHDANPGYAADHEAMMPVTGIFAGIGVTRSLYLDQGWSLHAGSRLRVEGYDKAHGLDQITAGLDGALRKKWGLGPMAPWTELDLSALREHFQEDLRRGWRYRCALRVGKRFSEGVDVKVEAWRERRAAKEGARVEADLSADAFSQSSRGFSLQSEIELLPRLFFTLAYLYRRGDVTFNSQEEPDDYPLAKAAVVDPTFGPGFYAYRVNGTSIGGRAGFLFSLTPSSALDLVIERHVTRIVGDEAYGRNTISLAMKFGF